MVGSSVVNKHASREDCTCGDKGYMGTLYFQPDLSEFLKNKEFLKDKNI